MSWESSAVWAEIAGDEGPWNRHLATAWQAVAADVEDFAFPSRPGTDADTDAIIAYWAPLLHLLVFGLGWTRPDLGLASWRVKRWPLEDPVLRTIDRWWGQEGVIDFLAWFALNGGIEFDIAQQFDTHSMAHPPQTGRFDDSPEFEERRRSERWQAHFGGGSDALHLTHHLGAPLVLRAPHDPTFFDARQVSPNDIEALPRFCVINDRYEGWYVDFWHYQLGLGPNGRSVRTEVFVRPIGFLGEFRQHRKTRLWFRGRSSVHLWGQNPA